MAYILFENGKKVGEIADWTVTELPAPTRMVLGKLVTLPKPKDQCTFVSPKPIHRKSVLKIIKDNNTEILVQSTSIKGGTVIVGDILEQRKI
jgi:hypothetical protein